MLLELPSFSLMSNAFFFRRLEVSKGSRRDSGLVPTLHPRAWASRGSMLVELVGHAMPGMVPGTSVSPLLSHRITLGFCSRYVGTPSVSNANRCSLNLYSVLKTNGPIQGKVLSG